MICRSRGFCRYVCLCLEAEAGWRPEIEFELKTLGQIFICTVMSGCILKTGIEWKQHLSAEFSTHINFTTFKKVLNMN